MLLKGIKRLGEPLGTSICAYQGGTAHALLEQMRSILENLPTKKRPKYMSPRKVPEGVKLMVLKREQEPPPGAVLLLEVEDNGAAKFTPAVKMMNGVAIIEIPLISAVVKPKRQRTTAGMIFSMVWRGNHWCDRTNEEHTTLN